MTRWNWSCSQVRFIPDAIEPLLWMFESSELCLNTLSHWKRRQDLAHDIIHNVLARSFVTSGKLQKSRETSEKNGTFGWTCSVIRLVRQIEHSRRSYLWKSPHSSAKRAALISSGKIKRYWTSSEMRLIRPISTSVKVCAEYLRKYELSGKSNIVDEVNICESD